MHRLIACRLGATVLAALVLGGCCPRPDGPDKAEKVRASHCRKLPANATIARDAWPLLQLTEPDLVSAPGADFQIIRDFKSPSTPLTIKEKDRIVLAMVDGTPTLTHYDKEGQLKAHVEKLTLDEKKLWASGSVVNALGNPAGTYFVYRTNDRSPCKHAEPFDPARCREFHFEYFAIGDVPNERPTFGVNIPEAVNGMCSGARETDEGDGDEGRRPQ